jgi:hypothetical protein
VRKRGWIILGVVVLAGTWAMVVGYEFLDKENALWQKKVKAAKEEQRRCEARYSKYRNFDQFRTSIRVPYASDLPLERWMHEFGALRAGMSESEVEIILGAPDYAECDLTKEGDKFAGSVWQYEVAVPQDPANYGQNSAIRVIFGPDGKVQDKSAVNMQPRPSPTPSATAAATPVPSESATPAGTATPASPNGNATPSATPGVSATPGGSALPGSSPQQAAPSATATPSPTPN